VFAGPLANFLFALVLLAGLFMVFGQQFSSTQVGTVVENSAADEAGVQPGDRILSLNGQRITRFEEIAAIVQLGLSEPLHIAIDRNGERIELTAVPKIIEETDNFGNTHRIGRLGIGSTGAGEIVRHGPLSATAAAGEEIYRLTAGTLKAVWQMIAGTRPAEELGGVIRIAKMSGDVAQTGIVSLIGFAALLSVNLGLINLFPVPMLDGGHLAFYAAEAISGKPLGPRAQEWGFRVGLALVLTLMVFATWNDLVTLQVVDFFKGLIT
jgi:regulator of sigma E protease